MIDTQITAVIRDQQDIKDMSTQVRIIRFILGNDFGGSIREYLDVDSNELTVVVKFDSADQHWGPYSTAIGKYAHEHNLDLVSIDVEQQTDEGIKHYTPSKYNPKGGLVWEDLVKSMQKN